VHQKAAAEHRQRKARRKQVHRVLNFVLAVALKNFGVQGGSGGHGQHQIRLVAVGAQAGEPPQLRTRGALPRCVVGGGVAFGVPKLVERAAAVLSPAGLQLEEVARHGALGAAAPLEPVGERENM
jgi:hypothetical protein